ncbi:MAG TPA: tRNA (guanosine(37)-N1)-methyltransferase TrmD [Nitrospiria bacterium]|jgi:tRNA (guanine37-N1)-methyltransferase|nr:tRNA (guanosine(37)-N1)-methyltransferase TrmD [Nitrospiria bacterium]
MMKCDIITLFPDLVRPVLEHGMLRRAVEKGLLDVGVHNLRDFTRDKHRTADDHPYGGGAGMVLKPEPIFRAVDAIRSQGEALRLILTSPQGRRFGQSLAVEFGREERRLVFICGRYEGVDERVREGLELEEISIGDYVLTGGELPALVMMDAAVRWVPGVLGDPESAQEDSFAGALLDYPHYTRPALFRGLNIPEVLISGNHAAIRGWRRRQALLNTFQKRPELLDEIDLTEEDRKTLEELKRETGREGVR